MVSQTEAVTTALEQPNSSDKTDEVSTTDAEPSMPSKSKSRRSKYRHVAAYHSQTRHSSLSREANVTTSFLGFRNLMVLVLGRN